MIVDSLGGVAGCQIGGQDLVLTRNRGAERLSGCQQRRLTQQFGLRSPVGTGRIARSRPRKRFVFARSANFLQFFYALRRNRCVFCRIYIAPFFRLYGAIVFELIDRRERSIALLGGDVEEYASGFSFFYYISLKSFYLLFSILVLYFRMYGNSAYLGAVF